jgi:hypothetical protein
VNVTPALPALSGGPRLTGGTLADLARPSREVVWRHLRALRHQPPGRASGGERRRVFGAALEQAQQLFAAAASVDRASQPILLFYGVSQAGRAIAASSTTAGKNDWRLTGHGIEVPNLDQRPELPDLAIANKSQGSFTQLAPLLHSGSLPAGASLGQIWLTIPDLTNPLLGNVANYLPTLRLAHLSEDGRPEFSSWIEGMPGRFAEPYTEAEFVEFCSSYPTLKGSIGRPVSSQPPLLDEERQSVQVRRAWTLPESDDPGKFHSRHTRPYLGDDDRYIFPPSEVISMHFTPYSHGGPFCSRSRCWPAINLIHGRLTSTLTKAPMPSRWRRFLIEPMFPARNSYSTPSGQSACRTQPGRHFTISSMF